MSIQINNGFSATTISATTFYGNGSNLTGVSAVFNGGTVTGTTTFTSGLSATTVSATTFYGDGSNLINLPTSSVPYGLINAIVSGNYLI